MNSIWSGGRRTDFNGMNRAVVEMMVARLVELTATVAKLTKPEINDNKLRAKNTLITCQETIETVMSPLHAQIDAKISPSLNQP